MVRMSPFKKVNSRRFAVLGVSIACLLGLTGGAALAVSATTGPDTPVPPASEAPSGSETSTVTAVEPGLAANVSLMRRAQTPADVVPAAVPVAFSAASGANLALARRVADGQGAEAWVIPGRGSTCILAQVQQYRLGGAVCVSTAAAEVGELNVQSASAQLPGAELVAGVTPDGVDSVAMRRSDGTTVDVPVRENVYIALVHGAVGAISASGSSGSLSIPAMSAVSASAGAAAGR